MRSPERSHETDEEVRYNLSPDEVAIFDRVRRGIVGDAYSSRTEAFRRYLEENPGEQIESIERVAEFRLKSILRPMLDFYETPAWAIRAILPRLWDEFGFPREACRILDAGCGSGAILRELLAGPQLKDVGMSAMGIEKELGRFHECLRAGLPVVEGDFFACQDPSLFDLIISNPPYSHAFEFVTHAITLAPVVCMLLRLGWLAGQRRAPWHRANPSCVYVLPRRPSFTGDGKTDASEYAWFVWDRRRSPRLGIWAILETEKCAKRGGKK